MVNDFPKIEVRLALNDKGWENLCNHFLDELEKQHKLIKNKIKKDGLES